MERTNGRSSVLPSSFLGSDTSLKCPRRRTWRSRKLGLVRWSDEHRSQFRRDIFMPDHFRCDKCNQDFQSQDQFQRHNQERHQGQGGGQQGTGGQQSSQYSGDRQGGSEYRQ